MKHLSPCQGWRAEKQLAHRPMEKEPSCLGVGEHFLQGLSVALAGFSGCTWLSSPVQWLERPSQLICMVYFEQLRHHK